VCRTTKMNLSCIRVPRLIHMCAMQQLHQVIHHSYVCHNTGVTSAHLTSISLKQVIRDHANAGSDWPLVPMCCSVLQCGSVCCIVLQWVAVGCSVLQCWLELAPGISVLPCVAVCCSLLQLQGGAVCCSVSQCTSGRNWRRANV